MIPKKIYLTEQELQDTIACERMVSIDGPYKAITEEYVNLKRVWHAANEEPKEYPILCQDELGNVWVQDSLKDYADVWEEFNACAWIIRWAYISDLLPKGGEV